jgi:hypothetical protein
MDFFMKMPRNKREMALFMVIVSVISVNIIAPLITCFELGFSPHSWTVALRAVPLVWPCVVCLVLITLKPAEWLTFKIINQKDSFGAFICVNILCSVFFMSIFLTVIGSWIGNGSVDLRPIQSFFFKWPRNFAVSFAVEALVAQPIARFALLRLHLRKDAAAASQEGPAE